MAATSFIFSINEAASVFDNAQILAQGFNVFVLVGYCLVFHCVMEYALISFFFLDVCHCFASCGIYSQQDIIWSFAILLAFQDYYWFH